MLKEGSWHLITLGDETTDVICIDNLRTTRLTTQAFAAPPNFQLAAFWKTFTSS